MKFSKNEYYEILTRAVDDGAWDLVDYLTRKTPLPQNIAVYHELVSEHPRSENVVIATIPEGYVANRRDWYRGLQDPWCVYLPPHYFEWLEGDE